MQGTPLQHWASDVQSCPYRPHDPYPPLPEPLLDAYPPLPDPLPEPLLDAYPPLLEPLLDPYVPPSGTGMHGPQMPPMPLAPATHDVPRQQSASLEHEPHRAMHDDPEHTYGAPPATAFGTQGAPLQQLALDAHEPPAAVHVAGAQRGTPTLSCLQVSSFSQLPAQQSHDELQDIVFSLHTSPSGLQPIGLRQTPTVAGDVMTHVTGFPDPPGSPAEPQQSASAVQRSPTTWQPLAGWHTSTAIRN